MVTPARLALHVGESYVPLEPGSLGERIRSAGFIGVIVEELEDRFCFFAEVPSDTT
jgi:hypothetical protein